MLTNKEISLMMQKDKIGAIKLIRERIPGLGLKEAKDMIDEWETSKETQYG